MKEYNFINMSGEIETITNLKKFGEENEIKNLNWGKISLWNPLYNFSKEENEFLKRYDLRPTLFNVACLQRLGRVFIFPSKLKDLKGGINKNGKK